MKHVERLAEKWAHGIAPALQTDYHRGKHCESFEAGYRQAIADILAICVNKEDADAETALKAPNVEYWIGSSDCASVLRDKILPIADQEEG